MAKETAALAPAAGSGIGKQLADKLLADPEFLQLMIDAAKDGLRATRSFWSGGKQGHIETEPDFRVRVQTLIALLAHMEGDPVKRVIHQHLGGGNAVDPLAALKESPALREAARRMLEKSEWHLSGRDAKPVEAVAIEVS